ncbi:sulfite reductase (NADPH) hemoprotein beta subunit [Escherichia coli]|uniref:Sulfite reductase (NADPH) hemoprotein beta subunit n=1 Tax=Escherichia coli TaxID=562 RepID=A0A2X3K543_ECOLX|nr:sulfite reductase (NADPH) hemoprotein beta subunit [Escherichia coli]
MAEAERFLPSFIDNIDNLMAKHGVSDEHIVMRVTGCPNGCGRAMLAEVGLVGKAPGSLQSASWRQPHWDTYPTDV